MAGCRGNTADTTATDPTHNGRSSGEGRCNVTDGFDSDRPDPQLAELGGVEAQRDRIL